MKRLSENTKGSDPKRNNRSCVGFGTEPKDDNGHFEDIEPGEHHTARHTAIHSDLQWWRGCIKNTILPAVISSTGLTASHTESFSEFLGVWLRDIVLSVGNIQMKVDDIHYSTTLSNYKFVGSPDSPSTAHSHNSSYLGMIYVDIEEQKSATFEGLRKTTKRYIQSVPICAIPIMLLSSACVLSEDHSIEHQTEQELGGSFVVKGKRRYIPHVRALLNNYPYTFYNTTKQQKYIQVRSNHLNSMHRSTSTLDLYFERDKIGRLLAVQIPKLRIPFLPTAVSVSIVLAILGWSVESFTRVVIDLLSSKLRPGLYAKYEVLLAGTWVSGSSKTEGLRALNKLYGKEQDDATTAQTIVRNEILPHLNEASDPCFEKGVYIAYMFSLLVLFEEELIPESDKDSLATTRIVTSAQSMASLFRILLLDSIRQGIRTIRKDLKIKSTPDISKIYRSSQLTSKLVSAVSTGIWSAKRKGVSHQLITQNKPCILAQMRKISSSVSNTDGKHVLPRMGEGCGLICALASTTRIAVGSDNKLVMDVYIACLSSNYLPLSQGLVSVNPAWFKLFDSLGRWLGFVLDIHAALHTFNELKLNQGFDSFVTYTRNNNTQELRVECSAGRLLRPLLVVANLSKVESILNVHSQSHFMDTHTALVGGGCIEYVSAGQESTLDVTGTFAGVFSSSASHLEITDVSFVGINAAMAPFFRHNQGPRLAYWIGMAKQAIHCTTQQDQGAATVHNLWYGQKPVVDTTMSRIIGFDQEASGVNCTVIFFPLNYNQEDAIIMNQASVERGMFVSDMTRSVEATRSISNNKKYNERFEKPNPKTTMGIKTSNHSHLLDTGLPPVGSKLGPLDTVIGKTVPARVYSPMAVMYQSSKFTGVLPPKTRRDVSVQMTPGESGVVHSATLVQSSSSEIAKVRVRATKIPEVGDKFSSRHSQKGTIGRLESPENLPFSVRTGMIPDIVMSPLGFPSRMTMGKLLEILIGKAVCMSGVLDDGLEDDCFDGSGSDTIEKMGNVLERHGFHASGKELFCDGVTGEMIEAHVMSGVVHYVKLHHMVSKKIHARATGPRHLLTHQPNEGRSNNGGLRFGPMEVDCTLAHSASEILRERMLTVSDEFTVFICSQCGFIADGNQVVGYFFCRFCRTGTHVRTVAMPYTSKLMLQELNASGVKVSLLLE